MKFSIYIGGTRLDLFEDENVFMELTVQSTKDITKVFSEYAQDITVPGSPTNNKIFKHWWNVDIVGGFNANVRVDATIEIMHETFKIGKVQLTKANLYREKIKDYTFTFFGDLIKLTDLFGSDTLADLDLTAYNHALTAANVKLGITTETLKNGDVIYPLISSERNWQYNSGDTDDIKYDPHPPHHSPGIDYKELKPALRLDSIIDAIEVKYGITFSSDFFTTPIFHQLYMWMSHNKDTITVWSDYVLIHANIHSPQNFELEVTVLPDTGYSTVPIKVKIENIATGQIFEDVSLNGYIVHSTDYSAANYNVYVAASADYDGTCSYDNIDYVADPPVIHDSGTAAVAITGVHVSISGHIPQMKIQEFLGGLFKMFNLTVYYDNDMYHIMTLDSWYAAGIPIDITKYVDKINITINRPDLPKTIDFKYIPSDSHLNRVHFNLFGEEYGDLSTSFDFDGGKLENQFPFENLMFERMMDIESTHHATPHITDVHVARMIDEEFKPVDSHPLIFFNKLYTGATDTFGLIESASVTTEIDTYNNVNQEDKLVNITRSLNSGAEISTWILSEQTHSLYTDYWLDYITDLYNSRRRLFNFKVFLPQVLVKKIKMNDKIIIRDRAYIIDYMQTNLLNGETNFKLLNDVE